MTFRFREKNDVQLSAFVLKKQFNESEKVSYTFIDNNCNKFKSLILHANLSPVPSGPV